MRREGTVVAIVVDEFGGAEGIVTIEDIMEEVVENLEDEYDLGIKPRHNLIQHIAENEYLVSARIEIDDLCNTLDISLPKGNYATLSGLILSRLHTIPPEGTILKEGSITMTVHRSTEQAVQEVKLDW